MVSARQWFFLELVLLGVLFFAGLLLGPPQVQAATVTGVISFVLEVMTKVFLAAILWFALSWLMFRLVLGISLSRLQEEFEASHNDSHAILAVGLMGVAVATLVGAGGFSFRQYLFDLATQGSLGLALGTVATVAIAWAFGVRSLEDFRKWINAKDNDSHAVLVAGALFFAMFLAMSS